MRSNSLVGRALEKEGVFGSPAQQEQMTVLNSDYSAFSAPLEPVLGARPIRLIFGDLELTPHELEGLFEVRQAMANDKELRESPVFSDDRYTVRFLQG